MVVERKREGEGTVGGARDGVTCERMKVWALASKRMAKGCPGSSCTTLLTEGQRVAVCRFDIDEHGVWSAWSSYDIDLAMILVGDEIGMVEVWTDDSHERCLEAFDGAPFPVSVGLHGAADG